MVTARQARWLLYKYDCSEFCHFVDPSRYQLTDPRFTQFLNSEEREIILLWARQAGKTQGAAGKVTHKATFKPGSLSLIVSASQRQAAILQDRVLSNMRRMGRPEAWQETPGRDAWIPEDIEEATRLVRCSTMFLELANGAQVVSAPASADTVRGYSPDLVIMDEAAWTRENVYEAIRPMLIRTKGQLVIMSTAGYKRGFFFEAWSKETGWEKIEIKASECLWVTAEELAKEKSRLPDRVYRREYENEFTEVEGGLFTEEMIAAMRSEEMVKWGTRIDEDLADAELRKW